MRKGEKHRRPGKKDIHILSDHKIQSVKPTQIESQLECGALSKAAQDDMIRHKESMN